MGNSSTATVVGIVTMMKSSGEMAVSLELRSNKGGKGMGLLSKWEEWKSKIIGGVIMRKVAAKFAKHAVGALIGLLSSEKIASAIAQFGFQIDYTQLETGLMIAMTGAFGAIWNYVDHRFIKKTAPAK